MSNLVKMIECPRDAWQGLPSLIPSRAKADYLNKLITAGFRHIDAVSFVSPKAVPQMADSELVLELIESSPETEIIGIVVNTRGAERAIATAAVQTLGFPYSISPTFLKRNQNQTPKESVAALEEITARAYNAGLGTVAYISMAFGNPYGDTWSVGETVRGCGQLAELGIQQISLADTVGLATPLQVSELVAEILANNSTIEIGVHLHARADEAAAKIRAAYDAGCRRFDSAIGGLGGCPFAQDTLVGNISTEALIQELESSGALIPQLSPLEGLIQANTQISQKFGAITH